MSLYAHQIDGSIRRDPSLIAYSYRDRSRSPFMQQKSSHLSTSRANISRIETIPEEISQSLIFENRAQIPQQRLITHESTQSPVKSYRSHYTVTKEHSVRIKEIDITKSASYTAYKQHRDGKQAKDITENQKLMDENIEQVNLQNSQYQLRDRIICAYKAQIESYIGLDQDFQDINQKYLHAEMRNQQYEDSIRHE